VDDWSRSSALQLATSSTAGSNISPFSSLESNLAGDSPLSTLSLPLPMHASLSPLLDLSADDIIFDDDVIKPAPQKRKASLDEE
jgi:hypothetical protein